MSKEDPRYHKQRWQRTRKQTRQLTRDRCCLCFSKAREVHHAYYGVRLLGISLPIAGYEIPGWQVFGLCANCHSNSKGDAHHVSNYRVSKVSPWLNCNRSGYLWKLRIRFAIALLLTHPLAALLLLIGLWLFVQTIFASEFLGQSFSPQFQPWQNELNSNPRPQKTIPRYRL